MSVSCNKRTWVWNGGLLLGLMCGLLLGTHAVRAGDAPSGSGQPAAEAQTEAEAAPATTWQDATKMFAAALTIGLSAFATAITQCRIGSAGVGALAENPKLFGSILIYLVIPETMVILGFVIAALIVF